MKVWLVEVERLHVDRIENPFVGGIFDTEEAAIVEARRVLNFIWEEKKFAEFNDVAEGRSEGDWFSVVFGFDSDMEGVEVSRVVLQATVKQRTLNEPFGCSAESNSESEP